MTLSLFHRFVGIALVVVVSACSSAPRNANVWDNYDVRHETGNLAAPYIDNDTYYAAPDCSIMDAPSCGSD